MSSRHLARAMERNIHALTEIRARASAQRTLRDKVADWITKFSGSMEFLVVHTLWFVAWIAVNLNWIPGVKPFDPFPFGLLTMVVSLEAIFLSTIVLISQNREAQLKERSEALDLQVNLIAEMEVTHTLRLVRQIADHLGIREGEEVAELNELCEQFDPRTIIHQIEVDDPDLPDLA